MRRARTTHSWRTRVAVVGVLAGLSLVGCERGNEAEGLEETDPARMEELRAAEAGADWLVEVAPDMPPGWAYTHLDHLSRVFRRGPRAERIRAALVRAGAGPPAVDLTGEIGGADLLTPNRLIPVLHELVRTRATGGAWQLPVAALAARIDAAGPALFEGMPLRQQPVVLDLLRSLQVAAAWDLDRVIAKLASMSQDREVDVLARADRYVYALTHVVLARSHYFERPADPGGLEFAIPVLERRVEETLAPRGGADADVFAFDLFAECVVGLELLGRGDRAVLDEARRWIVALQHDDGSWGSREGPMPRRIHPTLNAVMALLPLQERLTTPAAAATRD